MFVIYKDIIVIRRLNFCIVQHHLISSCMHDVLFSFHTYIPQLYKSNDSYMVYLYKNCINFNKIVYKSFAIIFSMLI